MSLAQLPDDAEPAEVERLPWPDFARMFATGPDRWRQGEHVALVGPTGLGKTTLALQLARLRRWCCLIVTKPKDATTGGLRKEGWQVIRRWSQHEHDRRKVVLHTPITDLRKSAKQQAPVVADALQQMYEAGSWTIILDDLQGLLTTLGLNRMVELLLLNARSKNLTIVASTQRPRWVPREVWTQSTHVFMWRVNDADDLRAVGGLGVASTTLIRDTVSRLAPHDFLYANTRTGRLCVSRVGGR